MQLNFSVDPLVLYWEQASGATTYHLSGTVTAVEVDAADPFCTPSVVAQTKQIEMNSDLAAGTESFAVNMPALAPADKWFVTSIQATIIAQDESLATIATGVISVAAEPLCGGPPSPPEAVVLTEDTTVVGCVIPAGFIEVTTQHAIDHGQRVFADAASGANRIYVRFRRGGCVHLAASADMAFPEFIPDDLPLSPASDLPLSPTSDVPLSRPRGNARNTSGGVTGPDTGTGPSSGHHGFNASPMLIIAASAIVLAGGGLALPRTRRR